MPAPSEFIVVMVTVGDLAEGERIADALVEERLAACVNIVGPLRSVYVWGGAVQREQEYLLLIKARRRGFEALATRVGALHSYEVPEIVAVDLAAGAPPYLAWLAAATGPRQD